MSGSREREFATPLGPQLTKVTVIGVTIANQHIDLSSEAIKADMDKRRLLTLKAEANVWYRWSTATSGETVDETATAGNNRCGIIFAGERVDEVPPVGARGIVVKGAVACKLRIWVGSESANT